MECHPPPPKQLIIIVPFQGKISREIVFNNRINKKYNIILKTELFGYFYECDSMVKANNKRLL